MTLFDYLYIVAMVGFSYMTLMFVIRNFQRKFDEEGNRIDLKDKEE